MSKVATTGTVLALAGTLTLGLVGCGGVAGGDATVSDGATTTVEEVASTDDNGEDETVDDGAVQESQAEVAGIWVPVTCRHRYESSDGTGWTTANETFEIDESGNPISMTTDGDGGGEDAKMHENATFKIDKDGLITSVTIDDGESQSQEVSYAYEKDASDKVTGVTMKAGGMSESYVLEYGDDGNFTGLVGNGLAIKLNEDGNLLSETEDMKIGTGMRGIYEHRYEYDGDGNLTKVVTSAPSMLGADKTETEGEFKCDKDGNLTEVTFSDSDGSSTMTYEYAYVANPSKGARLFWHGTRNLLDGLSDHMLNN